MEARLEPFSVVAAAFAVAAAVVSAHLAVGYERPSELPAQEPGAHTSIACDELPDWIERTRAQGYTSLVHVRARLAFRDRDRTLPTLVCPARRYIIDAAGRPYVSRDGVLLRITVDGRLVSPLGARAISPRSNLVAAHRLGAGLGTLAVLLGLLAWARRPFDPLMDHAGHRAPPQSVEIEPRSNDRVVVGGRELAHRYLVPSDGHLTEAVAPSGAHIGLPGAEQRYREAAGGEPYVHGPARVNGLRVAGGETTPLCDGDLVQLASSEPLRVSLPRTGVALRYLARDGAVRLVLRVRDARAYVPVAGAAALGIIATWTAHADLSLRLVLGAALAVAAIVLATRIPPLMARRVETRVPLAEVLEGRVAVSTVEEGQRGTSIRIDRRPAGRIPAARGGKPARVALEGAIARELDVLRRLGSGVHGSTSDDR